MTMPIRKKPIPWEPRYFTAEEAKEKGFTLDPDWSLKVDYSDGGQPKYSYISPEKWEFKDFTFDNTSAEVLDYLAISPEGKQYKMAELEMPFSPLAGAIEPRGQREYIDPQQFNLLKQAKTEGTLGQKELSRDLWLTNPQAKELGYEVSEGQDIRLSALAPQKGAVYGEIPAMEYKLPSPGVMESLKRIYPEKFKPIAGVTEVGLPQVVWNQTVSSVQQDIEGFIKDLTIRGDTPDTRVLLGAFGVEQLDIDELFTGVPEVSPFGRNLMKALPLIVNPRTLEWAIGYFGKNPDKLRRNLITVGRNADTEALVKQQYPQITDRGMQDYFSARVPGTVEGIAPEVLGQLPTVTWLDKVKEVWSDPAKLVPFVSSGKEIVTLGKLLMTAKDLEDGKEVSQEDLLALKAYVDKSTMDTTWGYEVADVLSQLLPFAGEFILTGGIFSAGKTATVKAGTEALKRIATKTGLRILEGKLAQYGIQAAGVVAGGTLRTIPAGVTRIPAATLEKQLIATLTGDEEAIWQSAIKAFGEQWVEVVSESTGGLFAPLSAPIKGQLVRVGLFKAFLKANPTQGASNVRRVMEKLGYHGVLEEMLEERAADVGHGILEPLGLSDQKFSIPSLQQLSVELVSFSIPGVAMKAIESVPLEKIVKVGKAVAVAPFTGAIPGEVRKPSEKPTPKEPFEYGTQRDYVSQGLERASKWATPPKTSAQKAQATKQFISEHRGRVEQALSEGKPVPPEVLKDYPDLKPAPTVTTGAVKAVPEKPPLVAIPSQRWDDMSTSARVKLIQSIPVDERVKIGLTTGDANLTSSKLSPEKKQALIGAQVPIVTPEVTKLRALAEEYGGRTEASLDWIRAYEKVRNTPLTKVVQGDINKAVIPSDKLMQFYASHAEGKPNLALLNEFEEFLLRKIRFIKANTQKAVYGKRAIPDEWFNTIKHPQTKTAQYTEQWETLIDRWVAFRNAKTTSEKIVAFDNFIGTVHGIGGMAGWFVEGGGKTLDNIRNIPDLTKLISQPAIPKAPVTPEVTKVNWVVQDKKPFEFAQDCTAPGSGEDITKMIDSSEDISYQKFISVVGKDKLAEMFPQYKWKAGDVSPLRMKDDSYVTYSRGVFKGEPAYYVTHSAIEYVFTTGEKLEVAIPKAVEQVAGEPEAGLQKGMFEKDVEVRPKGKGIVTQMAMDEQLKLQQARRALEPSAYLEQDPVAQYRFKMGNRTVGLDSLISIREQSFPEYLTVKQAQALNPFVDYSHYLQKGTKDYNKVPLDALDTIAESLGFTGTRGYEDLINRVMQIRAERTAVPVEEVAVIKKLKETPLEPRPELTPEEVTEQWQTLGITKPKYNIKQIDALNMVFADYINQPSVLTAWELTRELRRETRAGRAENLKARAQQLIVKEGITSEQALEQAIRETLSGELPAITTEYLESLTTDMRDALFAKVAITLKDEPYEMASTFTALTNALTGKPIPREPGVKGGSAYSRLQRVFGDQPKVLKAIEKMAIENKPLKDVVEGIYHEIGRAPMPIDQETADYLRGLGDIPYGYKTLLEKPFVLPSLPLDTRTAMQKRIDLENFKLELTPETWKDWIPERLEELSYLRINLLKTEYQTKLAEAGWTPPKAITDQRTPAQRALDLDLFKIEMAKAPIPVTRFEAPIENVFKQKPLTSMTFIEKKMVVRVLKELAMLPVDIGNLVRANLASFDFSFWRQIKTITPAHPVAFYRANIEAWKAMLSQKSAEANWLKITRDPLYQIYEEVAEKGKDFLRPLVLKKGTSQWKGVEEYGYLTGERLLPRLTQKIPWVKISARSFVTGTNEMTWEVFKSHYKAMLRYSEKIASGEIKLKEGEAFDMVKEMTDMAGMIADFTQRASLGKAAPLAPALSAMFFAPRSKLGRILTPRHLVSANPRVRIEAWKDLSLFVGVIGGLVMLGKWLDLWDVETDPRNAEWGSIRIGNLRIDPWAGNRQLAVFYARVISGTGVSSVTGAEYEVNPISAMTNFLRSSLAPFSSITLDFWTGKNFLGEKVDVANKKQWIERLAPFSVQNIWEAFEEGWKEGIISIIPSWVGEGVQTYTGDWKENFTKLGLPKYSDNLAYGLTEPKYDTADFWVDTSSQFKGVDPATLTKAKGYPEYIRGIAEARIINEYLSTLPSDKLVSLNADTTKGTTFAQYYQMWRDREKIVASGDEEALKAFDADERTRNAEKGNFSQRQFALLNEYWSVTDKKKQVEFLEKNKAEIGIKLRDEYLRTHPKENAQLAVWGQAKLLTREAYNQFLGLVKSLDIPDSALPEMSMPPEGSVDNYFKYQDMKVDNKEQSWEADLMMAKDTSLRDFLGLKPTTTPIASLELKTEPKYRNIYNQIVDLGKSDSATYIADAKTRKVAVDKLYQAEISKGVTYLDVTRKVEAIEKGTDQVPTPDTVVQSHVAFMKMQDAPGVGSSSAEVMLYRVDNPEYDKWRQDTNVWGDNALKPIDQTRIPIWRIDAKYAKEDVAYDALPTTGTAREDYLAANEVYRKDRRRRQAYEKGLTDQIENYVTYYEIPTKGKRQERFLVENPDFANALGLKIPDNVPNVAYDDLYDQYPDLFDDYDSADAKGRQTVFDENPAFKEAYYRRKAYGELWDEKYVDNYATYMLLPEKGYEKERFLKKHQDFYLYAKKKLGWITDYKWDEIPTEEAEKPYGKKVSKSIKGTEKVTEVKSEFERSLAELRKRFERLK